MSLFSPSTSTGRVYGPQDTTGITLDDGRMLVERDGGVLLSEDGETWLIYDMTPERAAYLAAIPQLGQVIEVDVKGYLRNGRMVRGYRRRDRAGLDKDHLAKAFEAPVELDPTWIPPSQRLPRSLGPKVESYVQGVQRLAAIGHRPPQSVLDGGWPAMRRYLAELYANGKNGTPARDMLPPEFQPGGSLRTEFRAYINPETIEKMGHLISEAYDRKARVMETVLGRGTVTTKGTMRGRTNYQLGQIMHGPGIERNEDGSITVDLEARAKFWASFYGDAARDVRAISEEYPGVSQTTILNIISSLSPGTVWGIPGSDKKDPHTNQGAARAVIAELQRSGKVTEEWFEEFSQRYGGLAYPDTAHGQDDPDPEEGFDKKLKVTGEMLEKVNEIWAGTLSLVENPTYASAAGGRKTANFARAISGDWDAYTVDRHDANMSFGLGYAEGTVHSPLEYDAAEIAGRRLSADLGIQPSIFQAITWGYQREIGVVSQAMEKDNETRDISARLEQIDPAYHGVKAAVARAIYRMRHFASGTATSTQVNKIKEELAKRFPPDHPIWTRTLSEVRSKGISKKTGDYTYKTVIALPASLTGLSQDYLLPGGAPALDHLLAHLLDADTTIDEMLDDLMLLAVLASDERETSQLGLAEDVIWVDGYTRADGTYVEGHPRIVHRGKRTPKWRPQLHPTKFHSSVHDLVSDDPWGVSDWGRVAREAASEDDYERARETVTEQEMLRHGIEHVAAVHSIPANIGSHEITPIHARYTNVTAAYFDPAERGHMAISLHYENADRPEADRDFFVVHEMGHWFDHEIAAHIEQGAIVPTDKRWMSEESLWQMNLIAMKGEDQVADYTKRRASGPMAEVMTAIVRSDWFRRVRELNNSRPELRSYAGYLLDPAEMFAQAYAHYIAVKRMEQGNREVFIGEVDAAMRFMDKNMSGAPASITRDDMKALARLYDREDFRPVYMAFERMLSSYGLTRKER